MPSTRPRFLGLSAVVACRFCRPSAAQRLSAPCGSLPLLALAAMAWFQVNCPTCDAALAVWLDEGTTPVQCSGPPPTNCIAEFDVYVPASFLPPQASALELRRRLHVQQPAALTKYKAFMKAEIPKVKQTLAAAGLTGQELKATAMTKAAANWATSVANPKNTPATDAADAADDAGPGARDEDERGDASAGVDMLTRAADAIELDAAPAQARGDARADSGSDDDDVYEDARALSDDEVMGAAAPPPPPVPKEPGRARPADPKGTPNKGEGRKRCARSRA